MSIMSPWPGVTAEEVTLAQLSVDAALETDLIEGAGELDAEHAAHPTSPSAPGSPRSCPAPTPKPTSTRPEPFPLSAPSIATGYGPTAPASNGATATSHWECYLATIPAWAPATTNETGHWAHCFGPYTEVTE